MENVLNGIAYDGEHKRIFVTGKLWPRVFDNQNQTLSFGQSKALVLTRSNVKQVAQQKLLGARHT
jgi:hypothetical protein